VYPLLVIEIDEIRYNHKRFVQIGKPVLPDAFLLQSSEKSLYHSILFWRVGSDVLLVDAVFVSGFRKIPGAEDKTIVGAHRQEVLSAYLAVPERVLEATRGDTGLARFGHSPAHYAAVTAVDDGDHVYPAVTAAVKVAHVDGPAGVGELGFGLVLLAPGPVALASDVSLPVVALDDPLHLLVVYGDAPSAQHGCNPRRPVGCAESPPK